MLSDVRKETPPDKLHFEMPPNRKEKRIVVNLAALPYVERRKAQIPTTTICMFRDLYRS